MAPGELHPPTNCLPNIGVIRRNLSSVGRSNFTHWPKYVLVWAAVFSCIGRSLFLCWPQHSRVLSAACFVYWSQCSLVLAVNKFFSVCGICLYWPQYRLVSAAIIPCIRSCTCRVLAATCFYIWPQYVRVLVAAFSCIGRRVFVYWPQYVLVFSTGCFCIGRCFLLVWRHYFHVLTPVVFVLVIIWSCIGHGISCIGCSVFVYWPSISVHCPQ